MTRHNVREESANTILSLILNETQHLQTIAERRDAASAPDLVIWPFGEGLRPIFGEAKIGVTHAKKTAAVAQVQKHLRKAREGSEVMGLALCYPREIAEAVPTTETRRRLEQTRELHWALVGTDDDAPYWQVGSVADMATVMRNTTQQGGTVAGMLEWAIDRAGTRWDVQRRAAREGLAKALALPIDKPSDDRALRVGLLIIANACLLHARLEHRFAGSDVPTPAECAAAPDIRSALADAWTKILRVDYAPVFEPALACLENLPPGAECEKALVMLAGLATGLKNRLNEIAFDHAGPLYHWLLRSARYDGSFYTSAPAAMLLARLAIGFIPCDWKDPEAIEKLRIIDPACGTGTLLMATLHAVRDRHIEAAGRDAAPEYVHLTLVQQVLCGLDINRHGVQLAACNLTMGAPAVDYHRMPLYTMQHGVIDGQPMAGSLEILTLNERNLLAPLVSTRATRARLDRTTAHSEADHLKQDLTQPHDLVIMNPPFTRNDIRNGQMSPATRKALQQREIQIAEALQATDPTAAAVIDQTSISTFFTPLADQMCQPASGVLAKVLPTTAVANPAGAEERRFLAARFQIDTVLTSHDPERIFFSENTHIHESMILARRRVGEAGPTKFVQLHRNPKNEHEALALAAAIESGEDVGRYGRVTEQPWPKIRDGDWSAAMFYDAVLLEAIADLQALAGNRLLPLGSMAHVGPEGRRIRDAFRHPDTDPSDGPYRILWNHETDKRRTIRAAPDCTVAAKIPKADYAESILWPKASRLLVGNKLRMNLVRTSAVWTDEPALGSAWSPVTSRNGEGDTLRAWAVWLNSTPGIVAFLERRTKDLIYPAFPLANLRTLPCPNPDVADLAPLVDAFHVLKDEVLLPWPQMHECPTRRAIDEAAARTAGIPAKTVTRWRDAAAHEPTVCGRRPGAFANGSK